MRTKERAPGNFFKERLLSVLFFLLTLVVLYELPPFQQEVIPDSVSCREYFGIRGLGPVYTIDYAGEDVDFVGPYQQCYVCILGNLAMSIFTFSFGVYLWKKGM